MSEEIDSDDSHIRTLNPRSNSSLAKVGNTQDPTAPAKAAEPRRTTDSRTTGEVDLGVSLLSSGQGSATTHWVTLLTRRSYAALHRSRQLIR